MLDSLDKLDRLERTLDRALGPDEETSSSCQLAQLSLLDFIPAASPRFAAPRHLLPLIDVLTRAPSESVRCATATPPRHGKTETLLHAIAWMLLREPRLQIAYISYGQRFAETKSRKAKLIAQRVGVPIAPDMRSRANWRTGRDDGGVWATGINGQLTGEGFHVMIIDDPVKGRATAESAVERDRVWDWLQDDAFTRLEPNGSVIVNMARWHPDDVSGRLVREYNYPYHNLPAITDGVALWPERYSVEHLTAIQAKNEYGWNSLYMGEPRGKGQRVFAGSHLTSQLPTRRRIAIGVDLAYSRKTHADWSVAVVLAESEGKFYVLDVRREQVSASEFAQTLKELRSIYVGATFRWYASTTERGLADLLQSEARIPIEAELATQDKFVRAQPVASAWNAGRILIPDRSSWANTFVEEVVGFTGVKDRHDDQVDALAAAYDALASGVGETIVPREIDRLAPPENYRLGEDRGF